MNKCMICDKLENRTDEFICDECFNELEEFIFDQKTINECFEKGGE